VKVKVVRENQCLVKVRKPEQIGSIVIPKFTYSASHNVAKFFRYQLCDVIDANGGMSYSLQNGDCVLVRRWAAIPIPETEYALLPQERILAKVE